MVLGSMGALRVCVLDVGADADEGDDEDIEADVLDDESDSKCW